MIKTFNTSTTSSTGTGSNALIYVSVALLAGYLGYRFWWKPMQDKKKNDSK